MAQFSVNPQRFDPYKNFKFRVKWDGRYVAGISKVGALKRSTELVEHREGGDPSTSRKSPGRTKFEAITLERGVTHDPEFENWANKIWSLGTGLGSEVSLKDFRKDIIIELYNEAGQLAITYKLFRCWVSEFQALPDLDANANAVAELVIGMLIAGSRNVAAAAQWCQGLVGDPAMAKTVEKGKKQFVGNEIKGKTLGVIGLGAIGSRVANCAIELGMEVYGYDPYISIDAAWNLSSQVRHCVNLNDMLPLCDYITIHVPYLPTTKDTINAQTLALCKDGVKILNYARGELVNTAALLEAIAPWPAHYRLSAVVPLLTRLGHKVCRPDGASGQQLQAGLLAMLIVWLPCAAGLWAVRNLSLSEPLFDLLFLLLQ